MKKLTHTGATLPATNCSPSSTPETDAMDTSQKARSWEVAYWNMREHARKLERERNDAIAALKANVEYDERHFERLRFLCFGDVSKRYAGWNPENLNQEMEWAEERTGETFRKLRDRVLGLQENVRGVARRR